MGGAASDKDAVQAWVRLRSKDASQAAPSAADTQACAAAVVKRVSERVGHDAKAVKVLPNLGAFIVSASPAFVQALAEQPEVESAKPTDQPMTLIRPVKSREVTLTPTRRRATAHARGRKRRPK